jgi:hypothetical protein
MRHGSHQNRRRGVITKRGNGWRHDDHPVQQAGTMGHQKRGSTLVRCRRNTANEDCADVIAKGSPIPKLRQMLSISRQIIVQYLLRDVQVGHHRV